jgi:hypothetical protein
VVERDVDYYGDRALCAPYLYHYQHVLVPRGFWEDYYRRDVLPARLNPLSLVARKRDQVVALRFAVCVLLLFFAGSIAIALAVDPRG